MQRSKRWMAGALLVGSIMLSACSDGGTAAEPESPATVEDIAGQADVKLVTLTDQAAQRLGIETAAVREVTDAASGATQKVVPYSSLLYDADGNTFVYTAPSAGQFVRASVSVVRISGDDVIVSEGPSSGTKVVTVGAAELLGTEHGVGEG